MHWVTAVEYIESYKLKLTFNDKVSKTVDLQNIVGGNGVFKPLKNINYFKNVRLDDTGTTVCWDNGADICPDSLYEM